MWYFHNVCISGFVISTPSLTTHTTECHPRHRFLSALFLALSGLVQHDYGSPTMTSRRTNASSSSRCTANTALCSVSHRPCYSCRMRRSCLKFIIDRQTSRIIISQAVLERRRVCLTCVSTEVIAFYLYYVTYVRESMQYMLIFARSRPNHIHSATSRRWSLL